MRQQPARRPNAPPTNDTHHHATRQTDRHPHRPSDATTTYLPHIPLDIRPHLWLPLMRSLSNRARTGSWSGALAFMGMWMAGSDARSAAAQAYRSLYATPEWRKLRKAQLARQPFCEFCLRLSRQTPATIVDHRQRHRGDRALFFDPANLSSSCKFHHDSTKQRLERGKIITPVGADGWPVSR